MVKTSHGNDLNGSIVQGKQFISGRSLKSLMTLWSNFFVKLKGKRHIPNVGVRMKLCEVFAIEWISQPSTAVMEEASQDK